MRLRDALTNPDTGAFVVSAVITGVDPDGSVSVDLGGGSVIDRCVVLASYTPTVGDTVELLRRDAVSGLVLGGTRQAAPATVTVTSELVFAYNVTPAQQATGAPNPLVVSAVGSSSWRENEGWYKSQAYQGSYNTQWGYHRGLYYYGSGAFTSLRGVTVTRCRIRLARSGVGGQGGPVPMWIAPHIHASQPPGAPYFTAGARNVGSLAWDGVGVFDLPASWGQALVDNRANGFGHLYLGTVNYAIMDPLNVDALNGQVTLDWY